MPKEAARIWLKVITVRVERVLGNEINPWVWIIEFERCKKPERV